MRGALYDDTGAMLGELEVPDGATPAQIEKAAIEAQVYHEAVRQQVRPDLAVAVAAQESNFTSNATSPKGAHGIMQVMPATAAEVAQRIGADPTTVSGNIKIGVTYLKQQLDAFQGDEALALAAYNAGPGAVQRYGGIPPYKETQQYVQKILGQSPAIRDAQTARQGQDAWVRQNIPQSPADVLFGGTLGRVMGGRPETMSAQSEQATGVALPGPLGMLPAAPSAKTAAFMALPPGSSAAADAAALGTVSAAFRAIDKARELGADSLSEDGLKAIGMAAMRGGLEGGLLGFVTRKVANAVTGAPPIERQMARETLATFPEGQRAAGGQLGILPPPTTSGEPFRQAMRGAVAELPKPDVAATDALYDSLRAAQGQVPLDVEPLAKVLDQYAAAFRAKGRALPTALDSSTLTNNLDEVLGRLNTINDLKLQKVLGPEPGLPGADLARLAGEATAAIRKGLVPVAQNTFMDAIASRQAQGQLERLGDLVKLGMRQGVPSGERMKNALLNEPEMWQRRLGDANYEFIGQWADALETLQKQPEGRAVFRALVEAATGAGAGAGYALLTGGDIGTFALGGAAAGLGVRRAFGTRPENRAMLRLIERLGQQKAGSEQFAATAGRLIALVADQRSRAPEPAPTPKPSLPPTPRQKPVPR